MLLVPASTVPEVAGSEVAVMAVPPAEVPLPAAVVPLDQDARPIARSIESHMQQGCDQIAGAQCKRANPGMSSPSSNQASLRMLAAHHT